MPLPAEANGTPEASTVLRIGGRPLKTAQDVADYFGVARSFLIWTLYKSPESTRYTAFEIPKRTGGMRQIHSPNGLVRTLQTRMHADLMQLYRAHPNAHGFIVARGVATNAREHAARRWVLNVDLEDFFPSINFGRIRGLFLRAPFDMGPAAAAVCAQIATFRNGLPQGAPTSPVLSNYIASELDRRLLRLAFRHKLIYSRYADDITFSTDLPQFPPSIAVGEQIEDGAFRVAAGEALEQVIAACGFTINPKKVRIQGRGVRQTVTGLIVNARVNIDRRRVRKLRAMLHAWRKFGLEAAGREHFSKYRGGHKTHVHRDTAKAFRNIVYGHLAFIKMVRGPADPIFLNFCRKVLELDPNPSRFIRQMVFGAHDYEIFISHAREDRADIARPIFEACQQAGLKAFLDEEHIDWGENFTRKINLALGAARTVLAVVSARSIVKEWPMAELNTALTLEVSGEKRVLVVLVGQPDLTQLPLVRGKDWLVWDGKPEKVAAELRRMVRGAEVMPTSPARSAVVPVTGTVASIPGRTTVPAVQARKGGFWSRMFGGR